MRSVMSAVRACIVGAIEIDEADAGITCHRVPLTARSRLGDALLDFVSTVPSGVRLEAITTSEIVELQAHFTNLLTTDLTATGTCVDLAVDGVRSHSSRTTDETVIVVRDPLGLDLDISPGNPATIRFDLGNPGVEKHISVWLPSNSATQLLDLRVADSATFQPAPSRDPVWIHHGSSISQCSEARRPTETWPAIAARVSAMSLTNLGLGGQCHLDQFMAQAIRDLPASAISLELGINVVNADSLRERTFVSAFHAFLDTVRDGHPSTPILIISPIICPVAEDRPGPTVLSSEFTVRTVDRPRELCHGALTLNRIRILIAEHVAKRVVAGDRNLHVLDGRSLFGPDDANELYDGLHPNAEGYHTIADRFVPLAFGTDGMLAGSLGDRTSSSRT